MTVASESRRRGRGRRACFACFACPSLVQRRATDTARIVFVRYVPFPKGLSLPSIEAELAAIAERLPGAFLVVDSLRGLMTRLSPARKPLHPHDPQDVEYVSAPFMEADKKRGLTVGIIDHAKKSGSDTDKYSTAGAGAKEAAVDAVYFWT